jgi:hypothetical protein
MGFIAALKLVGTVAVTVVEAVDAVRGALGWLRARRMPTESQLQDQASGAERNRVSRRTEREARDRGRDKS